MNALSGHKLIFLPGLDGTGISFEPLSKMLPPDVRVQVIRYPTNQFLGFEQTVQWVGDHIIIGHDTIVLAESFSGPVAVALVASGRIKSKCLILCATFARSPRPHLLKLSNYLPMALFMRLPPPRCVLKHIIDGGEAAAVVLLALWQRVKTMVPAEMLVHRLNMVQRLDVRPWLARLTVPCLYIQATGDRTVPGAALSDFTSTVPDLRVARIEGPHFILQAQPQQSLAAIEDFIRDITFSGSRKEVP